MTDHFPPIGLSKVELVRHLSTPLMARGAKPLRTRQVSIKLKGNVDGPAIRFGFRSGDISGQLVDDFLFRLDIARSRKVVPVHGEFVSNSAVSFLSSTPTVPHGTPSDSPCCPACGVGMWDATPRNAGKVPLYACLGYSCEDELALSKEEEGKSLDRLSRGRTILGR